MHLRKAEFFHQDWFVLRYLDTTLASFINKGGWKWVNIRKEKPLSKNAVPDTIFWINADPPLYVFMYYSVVLKSGYFVKNYLINEDGFRPAGDSFYIAFQLHEPLVYIRSRN